MGKSKGSKRALEAQTAENNATSDGQNLTELELARAAIIQRNRERLLALGIPSLRAELEGGSGKGAKKKKARKEDAAKLRVKREAGAEEHPSRRSTRLQEAQEHPKTKEESASEKFDRELGEFVVEGKCPRCGRVMERGHRQHLQSCTGKPRAGAAAPRPYDAALEELSQEERKDAHARLLARMKHLHLDGLTELSATEAKFAVLGSTGNHYTVTLKDGDKHSCGCLDFRFRRHFCKHICLVLTGLGRLDRPTEWRDAVEERMAELVQQQREQERLHCAAPPHSKDEEVGLKFV
ncbi:expressed protein [Chlorella variabilis]|uniref:Expressed protein n=1 Tax=Chlorella variabilis TaxID=554065 RepID=E1Z961_CHLVA|nr:expressed protein [Chlorella variabilis]EFN57723.1 expressed protein [Chlorella variabilis]|eukprot:XP_005849825.1 expressed protein [Chlorella variabilis]